MVVAYTDKLAETAERNVNNGYVGMVILAREKDKIKSVCMYHLNRRQSRKRTRVKEVMEKTG